MLSLSCRQLTASPDSLASVASKVSVTMPLSEAFDSLTHPVVSTYTQALRSWLILHIAVICTLESHLVPAPPPEPALWGLRVGAAPAFAGKVLVEPVGATAGLAPALRPAFCGTVKSVGQDRPSLLRVQPR